MASAGRVRCRSAPEEAIRENLLASADAARS